VSIIFKFSVPIHLWSGWSKAP